MTKKIKMNNQTPTDIAWKIYREAFTDGDFIVAEDYKGDYLWGKLEKTTNDGILITRPGHKSRFLEWADITFLAQDGFPVRELMEMTYDQACELADQTDHIQIRLDLLRLAKERRQTPGYIPTRTMGGGCPFVFENVEVIDLLFPGNCGPKFWEYWDDRDDEETLILQSKDGALCHCFDLNHHYLFDGLTL